ncbi:Arsenic efflux pump protein [Serratia marcescens]|uniref:Arsenic efflux pump protein n=1 Tax=Serratia marcescens TaxID=615 RepID=A0A379Z8J8_SERMA|nr:Arsenic efflux pump protein [Serratia marcescens]
MAAGFIADTASLPLVVSNLVNIVSADFFHLGFTEYAAVMVPVNLVAVAATLVMLHLFFRKDIPPGYALDAFTGAAGSDSRSRDVSSRLGGIGAVADWLFAPGTARRAGEFGRRQRRAGAAGGCETRAGRSIPVKVLRGAPWQIVIFSLGMYLVVYGLRNAGLTDLLSGVLDALGAAGAVAATLGTGFLSAFLSSVMNNMPTVLVGALSIDGSGAEGVIRQAMIYANVIGSDLGPKITPIGKPGHVAVAACVGKEKHRHYLGLLFPRRTGDDAANSVRHPGSAGAAAVRFILTGETVMSSIKIYHNRPAARRAIRWR